jgi:uncharacterized integral membrane protein (TIGR00698 family)
MTNWKRGIDRMGPGLWISGVVAVAAVFLANHYGAPVMLFALLLGMALNFLSHDGPCKPGLDLVAKQVLRLGVALLGLRITLEQVVGLGWQPVAMVVVSVGLTMGLGMVLARLMGFKVFFGVLTGGAVAICGASAALAMAAAMPQHPLKERATLFTVIGVSTLSTLAMMLYPMVTQALAMPPQMAGFFLGGTIHDVAQVVGAGYGMSPAVGDAATLIKLTRVAMLLPVIAGVSWLTRRYMAQETPGAAPGERPPVLPWFAVAFAALVVINSTGWLPTALVGAGQWASQWCLIASMAAIGMKTHLKDILTVGWKPVALMVAETLFLAAVFYGLMQV